MVIVIMGCGRVGARLAAMLDKEGHQVTVVDYDAYSFRRLPADFGGTALLGNGIDQEVLKRAGIEKADGKQDKERSANDIDDRDVLHFLNYLIDGREKGGHSLVKNLKTEQNNKKSCLIVIRSEENAQDA